MDAVSVRPGGGAVLEEEARARYLDLDFPAAIAAWERSYAAYRADGDAVGAVRMARTLAGMHGQITGDVAVMSGWLARTSRAGPQPGSRSRHSWAVGPAGPTIEEQRRPALRARSAKARTASGVAQMGTRLAPE